MNKQETIALVIGLFLLGAVLILGNETIALILAGTYFLAIIGLFKAMKLKKASEPISGGI